MKAWLLSFIFLFSLSAAAQEAREMGTWSLQLSDDPSYEQGVPPGTTLQKLLTLSTDRDSNTYDLHAMVETRGNSPTGMYVSTDRGGRAFSLAEIAKPAGVSLFEAQGRKVLILQGRLNSESHEGRMHLKYLANGLSMTYETCDVMVRRSGQNFWLQNAYTGARITSVKVLTYWAGVVTIEGLCPKKAL